jgi:hypothetical protein
MKISHCIVASDLNSMYLDFFELVNEYWKKINIKCILILIHNEIPSHLFNFKDQILLFSPLPNIPTAFQAQCIRILIQSVLQSFFPKEVFEGIILSDMDLIPLQYNYYHKTSEKFNENNFIVYRNVIEKENQYPICFCLATIKIWNEIFNISSIEDIQNTLQTWFSTLPKDDYKISSAYSVGWAMDQIKLFEYVNKWNDKRKGLIKLKDEETSFCRLDRNNIMKLDYNYNLIIKNNIKNGIYTDFHLLRPYKENIQILNFLLH